MNRAERNASNCLIIEGCYPTGISVMLEVLQFLATFCTSIFAGAALYINLVEHPARRSLDTSAAVIEWATSYKRATFMQAPLAAIGFIAGTVVWLLSSGSGWLVAAVLIGTVIPFTFIGIMPTNRMLLAAHGDVGSEEMLFLLEKWGRLHAVRTILSLLAALLMLWQLVVT